MSVTVTHGLTLCHTTICNAVAVVTREAGATLAAAGGAGLSWAGLGWAGRSDGLAASSPRHGSQVPHNFHAFKHGDF